ncbi:MAG: polysaccharide biosynthesis tyrosine autokinase [Lachnospiraceae bacterium]|nr:polysaccharide biosynthesis tyrosine autokinase [Lachnospiraceae bacterium]
MKTIEIKKPELNYYSAEACKSLRTNLQFCGGDKKVIVFTSCTENEGKTYVVLNLAISLSEIGKKVILLDADLRKSALLGRVDVTGNMKGLTHFLSKQASLVDIICQTNVPNFNIAFAGPVPPNPSELLSSSYFEHMLAALRESYDYILIDSPPLGSVVDSAIIASKCDGSVIVIEEGWNSYRFEQDIKQQLEKTNTPILGVILNKVDYSKNSYYGKYGKYGHYGKYGQYGTPYGASAKETSRKSSRKNSKRN